VINKFLQHLIRSLNEHFSDDRLERLFCRELSFTERLTAKCHLVRCRLCRLRQEGHGYRRTDEIIDLYRDVTNSEEPEWSLEPWPEFGRRLDLHLQQLPPRKWWNLRLPKVPLTALLLRKPILAVSGVIGCATAIFFWLHQSLPDMTANTLLVCAEKWDSPNPAITSGVVYQSIRITTPKLTVDRSIYRDLQGKRLPKAVKLAQKQEELKMELAQAGVDWEEPISASNYRTWHDHQEGYTDQIARVGAHLLKLTTTVPDNSVPSQSLTVRDTDFHPIQRTVAIRDVGTVEIAELDFKVLPLATVNADVFEPMGDVLSTAATDRSHAILELPRLPRGVTQGQLDEAELSARLMLNHLHADNGEQIEMHRRQQEIVIEGVVGTDERKRQLRTQLRMVPHLTFAIQSEADLKDAPVANGPANIQVATMPNMVSPLERSLEKHGRSVSEVNELAQTIANTAYTISQESKAIVDLQTRFASDQQLTIVASATLAELIYSHRERLSAAMKSERALIADAQMDPVIATETNGTRAASLIDVAARNLALSKELTQTTSPATRDAELILSEMSVLIDGLTTSANNVYGKSRGATALSGKK